jgi:hypothetical protein
VFTAQLLPGPQRLRGGAGTGGNVAFSVDNGGSVNYDPTLEGTLTGAGSSALGVNGRTVTIDATALNAAPNLFLDESTFVPTASVFTAQLLPGAQSLLDPQGTGGGVTFSVDNAGNLSYDPTLEGALTGAGSSALGVNGRTVPINVGALTSPTLLLDTVVFIPAPGVFTGHLLPGEQRLQDANGGGLVSFTVANDGKLSYDRSLEGALTGAGTSALGVNGRTFTIDARALAATSGSLSLDAVPIPTASVFTATLLPGLQSLGQGPFATVFFTLNNDGTLAFSNALAFSDVLEGRGTSTLTVKGETIHIDARALSAV